MSKPEKDEVMVKIERCQDCLEKIPLEKDYHYCSWCGAGPFCKNCVDRYYEHLLCKKCYRFDEHD